MDLEEYFECSKRICTGIFEELKESVKGYIRVRAEYDSIIVLITNGDFDFQYEVQDLPELIHLGFDRTALCKDIIKVYRKALSKKYFR